METLTDILIDFEKAQSENFMSTDNEKKAVKRALISRIDFIETAINESQAENLREQINNWS